MQYCLGFLFDEDFDNVVLIKKDHPERQKGLLNGVGGKIELENSRTAMIREFEEEAGIRIKGNWIQFTQLTGSAESYSNHWQVDCFYASASDKELMGIYSPTSEQVSICKVDSLKRLKIVPNLQWMIPLAIDHKNINYWIKVL